MHWQVIWLLLIIFLNNAWSQQLPISQYLNIRSVGGTSLSPDGSECAFLWNASGTHQVWKVSLQQPFPQQLTYFEDRVGFISWSPKGNQLLIGKDVGGNERTQLYMLYGDGSHIDTLTNNSKVIYGFGGWSHDGKWICFRSNERDEKFFDVFMMNIETKERKLIYQQDGNNSASGFSPDDKYVLVTRSESSYNSDIFAVEIASLKATHLTPHQGDVRFFPAAWTPDAKTLFALSDLSRDYMNVIAIDVETQKFGFIHDIHHDVMGYSISRSGKYEIMITNIDGYATVELRSRSNNNVVQLPREKELKGIAISEDEKKFLLRYASATSAGEYYLYDPATKKNQQILWTSYAGIPRESFIEPQLITYQTFDGTQVPAFFYLPKNAMKDSSFPCIVDFHGGHEGQSMPTFNSVTQYFLSRGYAVLTPNIRGSTGYGKEYLNADNARKRKNAIDDGAKAVEYLINSGYINSKKITAMGGSYGGFMTLAQLTFHPELWAAGIDIVGISNFESFLKNTGAWRARHRAAEYGDPVKDAEFLKSVSPLNYVEKIKAPLLVIQGANDPRVPKSEADQIVESIKKRGGIAEYLLYPDEGHGLAKLTNRISGYTAIVNFLDKYVKNK